MGILLSLALWALGLFVGITYFSTVILPLIYGFPKALYLSLRGEMRWMAPLHYLLVALGWVIAWTAIFFAIANFFPGSREYLVERGAFTYGNLLGTVGAFYYVAVSNTSNYDLRDDFATFTARYVINLIDDQQKYASLQACYEGMRNVFFYSIGGYIATIIANSVNNNFAYVCYLVITYIIFTIFIVDVIFKIFATLSSVILFGAKTYYWFVGDINKSRTFISFADLLAAVVALALNALPILVVYLSLSVVTPNNWNIFTFIGL